MTNWEDGEEFDWDSYVPDDEEAVDSDDLTDADIDNDPYQSDDEEYVDSAMLTSEEDNDWQDSHHLPVEDLQPALFDEPEDLEDFIYHDDEFYAAQPDIDYLGKPIESPEQFIISFQSETNGESTSSLPTLKPKMKLATSDLVVMHNYGDARLREKKRLSFEVFLILRFFVQVRYASKGQLVRYFEAMRRHFYPQIKNVRQTLSFLTDNQLIAQTERDIVFPKGPLKGHSLSVYFLTKRGRNALKTYSTLITDNVTAGEPIGHVFDMLPHDILVTEAAVVITEKGHFIMEFFDDRELRRQRKKQMKDDPAFFYHLHRSVQDHSFSDFGLKYVTHDTDEIEYHEGEVAVKYPRSQIWAKPDNMIWFCYDRTEAEKIWTIKDEKPIILGDKLLREVGAKSDEDLRTVELETDQKLLQLFTIAGGVSAALASSLLKIDEKTSRKRLSQIKDLVLISSSVAPGLSQGRTRTMYILKDDLENYEKVRNAFFLNLYLIKSVSEGKTCGTINERIAVEAHGTVYICIPDCRTMVNSATLLQEKPAIQASIDALKTNNVTPLFIVTDEKCKENYEDVYSSCEVVLIDETVTPRRILREKQHARKQSNTQNDGKKLQSF